jgi:uncharacterized protein (DUF1501 family)
VLSTNLASFDTHADQKEVQAGLLRKLDQGLAAFLADLAQSEAGRETLVLVYSEFGRRVAENASRGTDHGKAGPVFVLGARARGGLYGKAPRLDALDDGDVAFTTDSFDGDPRRPQAACRNACRRMIAARSASNSSEG